MIAPASAVPSKATSALSVARLTAAVVTPGTAAMAFSTRRTQDAQVMPSIGKLCRMAPAARGGFTGAFMVTDLYSIIPRH